MIQYSIKEIIDWVPSFSLLEIVTQKGCFFCFIWVLKVPVVDTDPKRRFLSFKVTVSNESSLLVPLQGIAPENSWLGALFGRTTQNHMQNKNEGSENKIMLGDLNCTMDKIDRDDENKTQIIYRCCSNYALSKLFVDNGLEDLWRRENPEYPEYDRSFAKGPRATGCILLSILI